jgi:chaperonin GroES
MQALEETNLAEELDAQELQDIARQCIEEYEQDLQDRAEWEQKHSKWLDIYYQQDAPINGPWDGSSKESIPLFTEAVNQFQSRTYKAFFPNRYFVDAIPTGNPTPESRERADRVARHMSYQLGVIDRTYKINKNQMFMAVALHGSDFTKTYWSRIKQRTVIERVRATDLVVPYTNGPCSIEDLERKTHVKFETVNNTALLAKAGYFLEPAAPYNKISGYNSTQGSVDQAHGLSSDGSFKDKSTALILEQHRLLDLDGDGIAEPYVVWIDYETKKVLRIQIRYEVDENGFPIRDKEPIEHFTHYQFMPNPDGFYGLGLGHLLGNLNLSINKLTRMFIDATEMSTKGNLTHLISDNLGLPGDNFDLEMGVGIKIPRNIEDVSKGFVKLNFPGPSPEIQVMLQYLQGAAQRISSSSDILAGQPEKVYQPTALLSMMEQGLQLYSSVQEFIGHSMEDELNKVYRLNAKYMTSEEYYFEDDEQISVVPQDYQDDFRIVPVFDPKYTTRSQKLAKAQAQREFVMSDPIASQDQKAIWLAGRAVLEALDAENIDEMLPEPQVPEVARIDSQNLENAYFLMPPDKRPLFDVFPDQDHLEHIKVIDSFIAFLDGASPVDVPNIPGGDPGISRIVSQMSNEQKKEIISNILRHRSLHLGFMYAQLNGVMDQNGQPIGQGQAGSMAGAPSDEAGLAEIIQSLPALQGSQELL